MKQYLIEIAGYVPAPRRLESRQSATSVQAAVSRALREFRKAHPRKRVDRYLIDVRFAGQSIN